MPTTRVTVTTHGKFFTGQASREVRRTLDFIKKEVAKQGVALIKARLNRVLKEQNTPYGVGYVSQIQSEVLHKFNDQLIHDGGVIYGPWLEGTSNRNRSTRFKGYRTFRRVRTKLRKVGIQLAQRRIDRLIVRWNS